MRLVIALGGNALFRRSDPMTTEAQRRNIKIAAQAIAPPAAGHSVVVVALYTWSINTVQAHVKASSASLPRLTGVRQCAEPSSSS
jgi:carbamate kinase